MTKEKNLKSVKVIKEFGSNNKHYEDCNVFWSSFSCDCGERMEKFVGWKISDLTICRMEATSYLIDKRLMYKTRIKGEVDFHCTQGCAETWRREYC